jgi:hypothetical protein
MNAINVDIVRSLFMPLFLGGTLAGSLLPTWTVRAPKTLPLQEAGHGRSYGWIDRRRRRLNKSVCSAESWRPTVDESDHYVHTTTL